MSGVAASRGARTRTRGSGSTASRGTTADVTASHTSSPASSLASSGGSGSPPLLAAIAMEQQREARLLLSPGKRVASRDPSEGRDGDGRRRRSPVVGGGM